MISPLERTRVIVETPRTYDTLKRALDVIVSALALAVLAPLGLLLALAVYLDDPGPALFRQRRIGRRGRPFTMLKFRSMVTYAPNISTAQMQATGKCYGTRVGGFLRKTSLDELPQLWNVLCGDMSLVGPRPALDSQADLIRSREIEGVHAVRPGITGLAQVMGRDDLLVHEKVALDREYVQGRSLALDARVVVRTLSAVLTSRGNH